jgi:hypothetical protein
MAARSQRSRGSPSRVPTRPESIPPLTGDEQYLLREIVDRQIVEIDEIALTLGMSEAGAREVLLRLADKLRLSALRSATRGAVDSHPAVER